jgi:PAS domain S-box-containing protein
LRQDEQELRRITDAIPQTIVIQDPNGNPLYANQAVLDYTGLTMEDVLGSDFHARIFHPEDLERVRDERRAALVQASKAAPTGSTVLILGETGTGKELIARAIHNRSTRSARAFIRVNCAAIPPSLIASELFGHERGSFTGALQRRLGRKEETRSCELRFPFAAMRLVFVKVCCPSNTLSYAVSAT